MFNIIVFLLVIIFIVVGINIVIFGKFILFVGIRFDNIGVNFGCFVFCFGSLNCVSSYS